MSETSVDIGGGFTGLLTIVFIILKLCNVIDWSWWWVLSPLWIPIIFTIIIVLIILITVVIYKIIT